jgi:hypothetical protein
MQLSNFNGFEGVQERLYYDIAESIFANSDSGIGYETVSEGYYETPRGRRWPELVEGIGKYFKTVPVAPTDATGLLMEFYNGNAWVADGRDISEEEYREGARVCLVSEKFAKNNDLSVGDDFTAPLYFANYANTLASLGGISFPLLNPDGKSYEVFEEITYEIAGIYRYAADTYTAREFLLAENTVIVPAASVKNSDAGNIAADGPMQHYNTSFQIPNGSIESWLEEWGRQEGAGSLEINFYDKNFTLLQSDLNAAKHASALLLAGGLISAILISALYVYMSVVRQSRATAIERACGAGAGHCAASMMWALTSTSAAAAAGGAALGYFRLASGIGARVIEGSRASMYDATFSNWLRQAGDYEESLAGIAPAPTLFVLAGVMVLAIVGCVGAAGIRVSLRDEPLKLLGAREG